MDNYEVIIEAFHHSWSFSTQIKGGLNQLLSRKWKLPNYIFIMFSNDQIVESEILGDELYNVIANIFRQVARAITERRALLPKRAKRHRPPIVNVVRTVPKSDKKQEEKNFKHKRRTLNRAIQKIAADFKWRTINVDSILPKSDCHFDEKGDELSKQGLEQYWKFISEDLRDFDYGNHNKAKTQ